MLFPVSNGCSRPFRGKASAVGVEGGEARFSMCILYFLVGQKCLQNIKCVRYGGVGWGKVFEAGALSVVVTLRAPTP